MYPNGSEVNNERKSFHRPGKIVTDAYIHTLSSTEPSNGFAGYLVALQELFLLGVSDLIVNILFTFLQIFFRIHLASREALRYGMTRQLMSTDGLHF